MLQEQKFSIFKIWCFVKYLCVSIGALEKLVTHIAYPMKLLKRCAIAVTLESCFNFFDMDFFLCLKKGRNFVFYFGL